MDIRSIPLLFRRNGSHPPESPTTYWTLTSSRFTWIRRERESVVWTITFWYWATEARLLRPIPSFKFSLSTQHYSQSLPASRHPTCGAYEFILLQRTPDELQQSPREVSQRSRVTIQLNNVETQLWEKRHILKEIRPLAFRSGHKKRLRAKSKGHFMYVAVKSWSPAWNWNSQKPFWQNTQSSGLHLRGRTKVVFP